MIIVPEPRDPDVPILPPLHPDGGMYRYSMLYEGGLTRAYADSYYELCGALLDGYRDAPEYAALPPNRQYQQRYLYCKQVQVWLQAAINGAPTVRPLLAQASEEELNVLYGNRAGTVQVPNGVWTSPIPLALVTTDYAPTLPTPRPVSQPPPGVTDPLVWLDPSSEERFLRSLVHAGQIGLSEAPLSPRLAPGHPYDPQRGDGLRFTPAQGETDGTVELWHDGKLVETHEHPEATPHRYWGSLSMTYDFERVTAWYFVHAPTCRMRLDQPDLYADDYYPDPDGATGTIQFGDETQPVLTWTARTHTATTSNGVSLHQWAIDVPVPPGAEEPTLPLRLALAYQVFRWVQGDDCFTDWREVQAVFDADSLIQMLPTDERGHWRLAGEEAPVRTLWLRWLGLEGEAAP